MTHRVLFGGILAAGAVLRFWGLGRESLWHDEAWTWYLVRDSLGELFHRLSTEDAHPPLYFLLLWPWVKLGDSEAMLRLPSAIVSVASLPLFYRLVRGLSGPREGLLAMGFLAASPIHLKYSQEARSYALLFFLCLLSLSLLQAVRRDPRRLGLCLALAVVTAVIVYTEYLGVFFILGEIALVLAWSRGDARIGKRCLVVAVGSFLLFLPWLPSATHHLRWVQSGFWMPKPSWLVVGWELSQLTTYEYGYSAVLKAICSLPIMGLALGAPVLARRKELWIWLLSAAIPVIGEIAVSSWVAVFCARGLIFVLAPLVALAATGAAALRTSLRTVATASVLICALPGIFSIAAKSEKEDWRSAVTFLKEHASQEDLVLVHEGFLDVNLEYYWRSLPPEVLRVGGRVTTEVAARRAREHSRVWLVRRTYVERPELPELLAADFPKRQESRWRRVSVLRMAR